MLDRTMKEVYLIVVAIANSHNLCSAISEKLQKCTDVKEALTIIWQLNSLYVVPLVLSTMDIVPK
jgi:hypothetical protein